jgi:hypothetical protein
MQAWAGKILFVLAVLTILCHNMFPHQHHDEAIAIVKHEHHKEHHAGNHHHHEKESNKDHGIFSFAQLDEGFIPTKIKSVSIDLPACLLTPAIAYQIHEYRVHPKMHFGFYREYPPPDPDFSHLPLRGPPIVAAA